MKKTVIILSGILIMLSGCEKGEIENKQDETIETSTDNLTLREFIESRESEVQKNSFRILDIINNSELESNRTIDEEEEEEYIPSRPMEIFSGFWHSPEGFTPYCYGDVISYCGSLGNLGLTADLDLVYPMVRVFESDKIILDFETDQTGFTIDGYLPLNHNISIDPDAAIILGIPEGSYIEMGIYTADYDPEVGYYNSVIVDLGL